MAIDTGHLIIDATGRHTIYNGDPTARDLLVKNIGPNTVYVGRCDTNSSQAYIDTGIGYPIAPGESCVVPASLPADDRYLPGFNTESGTSEIRYIGAM